MPISAHEICASWPDRRPIPTYFIEQPRYPGRRPDRRLCVPAFLLVCPCSDELFCGVVTQSLYRQHRPQTVAVFSRGRTPSAEQGTLSTGVKRTGSAAPALRARARETRSGGRGLGEKPVDVAAHRGSPGAVGEDHTARNNGFSRLRMQAQGTKDIPTIHNSYQQAGGEDAVFVAEASL